MNNFSNILSDNAREINEAYARSSNVSMLSKDITDFLSRTTNILPPLVRAAAKKANKYRLRSRESIEDFRKASKASLKGLCQKYGLTMEQAEDIWNDIRNLKDQYRIIPQYMTPKEREMLEVGKLTLADLTIDLDSPAGRNNAAKMYMPMVYKIVNQYMGKSSLSKADLISAGLDGFSDAMNQWRKPSAGEDIKSVPFKTYASYRIKQQILNDMNVHSHGLAGGNWYNTSKYGGMLDTKSLDTLLGWNDENGEWAQDKLAALGTEDTEDRDLEKILPQEQKMWDQFFDSLEKKFDARTCDVFYRYFGLKGHKREKTKDIAKSIGKHPTLIKNNFINKVLRWVKETPSARATLSRLRDMYNESLMCDLMVIENREDRLQALCEDDTFLLLEEECRWDSQVALWADLSRTLMGMTSSSTAHIRGYLKGMIELSDEILGEMMPNLRLFFSLMCPTYNVGGASDEEVVQWLRDLREEVDRLGISGMIKS